MPKHRRDYTPASSKRIPYTRQMKSYPASRRIFRKQTVSTYKETKSRDIAATDYALNTTGTLTLLSTIGINAGPHYCVSDKYINKMLEIRGNVLTGPDTTYAAGFIAVILDQQCAGRSTLPAISDIFDGYGDAPLKNLNNDKRFKILWIQNFGMSGQNTSAVNYGLIRPIQKSIALNNIVTELDANTGGGTSDIEITSIEKNALYLVTYGGKAGTSGLYLHASTRLHFVDY